MNQKRITNQILEQKDFTLNSTLNYLFNISNMKKLFSYLLISSMVVLSSCTNYDDQFDDLNTQINSLKSQIEGFSSLSSGLTALQGTVSSLQSAVAALPKTATPATDISGLEASVAALQTSLASASTSDEVAAITTQLTAAQAALATAIAANATAAETNATSIAGNATAIANLLTELESLATSLATIKTDLAAADTSVAVAQLSLDLAAAQANLTELLEANKIYTPTGGDGNDLVISSASELAVAKTLGDKLTIVNGDVKITNKLANAMSATELQAVVDKMVTITGELDYSHGGLNVTNVNFTNLTSTANLTVDQEAPISFPKLASAATVVLTNDVKVTSVSFPVLAKVSDFSGNITFSQATSLSMPLFTGETGNTALEITLKTKSTIDLSAINTLSKSTGEEVPHTLSVTGPSSLTLANWVTGKVTTNAEVLTLPKAITNPGTTAAKLKEIHLHAYTAEGTLTFGADYVKLATVDIIGSYDTKGLAATVAGPRTNDLSIGTAALETLTLAGHLGDVTISNASGLSSVTTSGGMTQFKLSGATELSELTLGHTSNSSSTLKRSDLILSTNSGLTKVTADKINYASNLTIEDNVNLETISLAGLTAIATEKATENVSIKNNNFVIQSFQLPSTDKQTPVVKGKITSNSGINTLSAYLAKAAVTTGAKAYVEYDKVLKAITSDGKVYETGAVLGDSPTAVTYSGTKKVTVVADNLTAFVALNIFGGTTEVSSDPVYQKNSMIMVTASQTLTADDAITFKGDSDDIASTVTNNATFRAGIPGFIAGDADTWFPSLATELAAKIKANGLSYTLEAKKDYGKKATYVFNTFTSTGVSETQLISGTDRLIEFDGFGAKLSATILTPTQLGLLQAMEIAFNASALTKSYYVTLDATSMVVKGAKVVSGTRYEDPEYNKDFPTITFSPWKSSISNTLAIVASQTVRQTQKVESADWRLTVTNPDRTRNARNLQQGADFLTINSVSTLSFVDTANNGALGTNSGTLQTNFDQTSASAVTTPGVDAGSTDFTDWM